MRVPKHIGIIPDGNRRWAEANKMAKEKGYECGIDPGFMLFKLCKEAGIKELTYYGFTTDNTKRPTEQRKAFTNACICAVKDEGAKGAAGKNLANREYWKNVLMLPMLDSRFG